MLSFDTNILVHAASTRSPFHDRAIEFLQSLISRKDVVVCELVLVELYLKLRNEKIIARPLSAKDAAGVCFSYRENLNWALVDSAPVMEEVWRRAGERNFAFRRIIDVRLALTLKHHGVTEFATSNVKDFQDVGFARVWNPLTAE